MRKERFFRFWDDLDQVIPIMQTQCYQHIAISLVSLESYKGPNQGFLFTVNLRIDEAFPFLKELGQIYLQALVTDDEGHTYSCFQAHTTSTAQRLYASRLVLICTPNISKTCRTLFVQVGPLEWEYTAETESRVELIPGSWTFRIDLDGRLELS